MKSRYRIGFFCVVICSIFLLNVSYNYSYQLMREKQKQHTLTETQKVEDPSVMTDGTATKNSGYYLSEYHDYIVVYLFDKKTVFQYTNIKMDQLPEEVQNEIHQMKYIKNQSDLYGFLENYSS